jgi:serine/threonine protein kinase
VLLKSVPILDCYYLEFLHDSITTSADTSTIDWDKRFKIIKGICHGLDYLHSEKGDSHGPLIHMNLLPQTIWLDEYNWVPKIADFGLSRLFGKDQTRINTMNVVGHK